MSHYDPDEATARADLCRFLAACFYEPTPAFAEEKLFDHMVVAAKRIHPDLADQASRLGQAFAAHDLQELLVDYTRLFLGPMAMLAKPYGSSWLGAPTSPAENPLPSILALYREGGFELDPELAELPDHVAIELEFLYLLIFTAHQAALAGDAAAVAGKEALLQRFFSQHLGAWIGPFTAAVAAGAETPFYRELASLTERFLRMDPARPIDATR